MTRKVYPRTFLIGHTTLHFNGLSEYLEHTGQEDFHNDITNTQLEGMSDAEMLPSFYAKLCYRSLSPGKNENISKTRGIKGNLIGCLNAGHGSVYEHPVFNFVTTGCSRVFTHELVRHRTGTAFSQTSGRYVRSDKLEMVLGDPVLSETEITTGPFAGSSVLDQLGLMADHTESTYNQIMKGIEWDKLSFYKKKKLTSALRRILPNGQSNEIGWSANVRALRHMIQMRTSRHAEWEIRLVFSEVYDILSEHFPMTVHGGEVEEVDGLKEVTGLKV